MILIKGDGLDLPHLAGMFHWPVFATAFRVFFLATGLHALFIISVWLAKLTGSDILPTAIAGTWWHSYEMVFGFCRAAILGFLFTAGQNWCGQQMLTRGPLAIVFTSWLLGRVAWFLPAPLVYFGAGIDILGGAFALTRMKPLLQPVQKHNHKVVYLHGIFIAVQLLALIALLTPQALIPVQHSIHMGLLVVLAFIVIIAGRILPFFTSLAIPEAKPRISQRLENSIFPMTLFLIAVYAALPLHDSLRYAAAAAILAFAGLNTVRWLNWNPLASWRKPILAILFSGYLWLLLGLMMLAASLVSGAAASPAWHVLGIGSAAIFIFGMMTRVSLGHTGRKIHASPLINAGYVLIHGALVLRVALVLAGLPLAAYTWSAALWLGAFSLFTFIYATILWQPRIDGKPG
ncbi:MAG TPA: NnrS family protein [Turneriella sp.]|nr:NnrS family protein [Turneriella sp.]HNL53328.1 NnrS family protein [Turneriella sp.]